MNVETILSEANILAAMNGRPDHTHDDGCCVLVRENEWNIDVFHFSGPDAATAAALHCREGRREIVSCPLRKEVPDVPDVR
jgi:hypothetical protein